MKGGAPKTQSSSPSSSPYNYVPPNAPISPYTYVPPNNHHSANGRNGWNNRHSEPNCCLNGTCNICGHPPMDRTASSIWDMIGFIDAYNSTSNNNRWKFSLQSKIKGALWEMTNFSGHESLQYPDPEQCLSLCNSLSEIKDDEELEELLKMINKKFNALFDSNFVIKKKPDFFSA